PPPLPTGLLPRIVEDFAFEKGRLMGADPAGLAMSALAVCAAAVPDKIRIKVKQYDSWFESTRIWVGLVGDPSTMKSPVIRGAVKHLKKIDRELWRKYVQEKQQWEALPREERRESEPPKQERAVVEDVTIEAMQEVLRDSPNGVLCIRDEL